MKSKAIVKREEEDPRFSYSFFYKNPDIKIDRQFNSNRDLKDSPAHFLDRIKTNLEKQANKKNKQKKGNNAEPFSVDVNFYKDGEVVECEKYSSCEDFIFQKNLEMKVIDTVFEIVVNPPIAEEVKLTSMIMSNYLVYPIKLKLLFCDKDDCLFEWFKSQPITLSSEKDAETSNKKQKQDNTDLTWTKLGEGYFLKPDNSCLGSKLKLTVTPRRAEDLGEPLSVVSTGVVEAGPGHTPSHSRHQWTSTPVAHPSVRVISYNILADLYADSDFSRESLFPQCPPYALSIDYRIRLILDELIGYNGDVVLLQEVDRKVFEGDLAPVLLQHGFTGVFTKKGGQTDEGEACFFRTSRFKLMDSHRMFFTELLPTSPAFQHLWNQVKQNSALVEKLAARNTILQAVVLASLDDPSQILVVGNTHLYFSPTADHIRLLQASMCLTGLQTIRDEVAASHPSSKTAMVMCGDFNSTPPFGVLEYVRSGFIPSSHADWSSCEGEEVKGLEMSHSLSLDSACGTPKYTNYTVGFKECIDYIFYETDKMEVGQIVPFPQDEELADYIALPNIVFPSDHIASVADLVWK